MLQEPNRLKLLALQEIEELSKFIAQEVADAGRDFAHESANLLNPPPLKVISGTKKRLEHLERAMRAYQYARDDQGYLEALHHATERAEIAHATSQ